MIKTIVKLDGTTEDFSPHKINGWGIWAAEHLGDKVDWSTVVIEAVRFLPETATSQELQLALINACLDKRTWSYYRMAGRLYAAYLFKKIYNGKVPTVQALHSRLAFMGIMAKLNYSDAEYAQVEQIIDHDRDYQCPHFSLHHSREKYALKNRVTGEEYETQQFMYMRMAMAMAEDEPRESRMHHLGKWYEHLSGKRLSAPTPNYVDFGTPRPGLASCCLLVTGDDGQSLAITSYIANIMTQANAGIGVNLITRSVGDSVRNGTIKHLGKKTYIDDIGKSILANTKNGRGGAGTLYFNSFDPESAYLSQLRNPRQTEDKKNRDLHYAMMQNRYFASKAAAKNPDDRKIFVWNCQTSPELHKAFYGKSIDRFVELYKQYEADDSFKKLYIDARELTLTSLNEAYETGTAYLAFMDEINRHTPFKDPIFSSNLCLEVAEPTSPYYRMEHVYSDREVGEIHLLDTEGRAWIFPASEKVEILLGRKMRSAIDLEVGDDFITADKGNPRIVVASIISKTTQPEIAMCSLGATCVDNIENDAQYLEVMYYGYKMIDYCIGKSIYPLPHVGFTAKQRMNAGMGMMGLATHMARNKLKYSSYEGKQEIHWLAERHMYMAIEASLMISKERGNAPWIHKTLWPEGWNPLKTYNRGVDEIGDFSLTYNWADQEARVIANGGIAHSCLVNYMPGESSSKAAGLTNSIYAIRRKVLKKTDEHNSINWAAPFSDDPEYEYQLAWDIPTRDMIDCYALFQKFTDQSISADLFRRVVGDEKIKSTEMLGDYLYMVKRGLKTRYYMNTETAAALDLESLESAVPNVAEGINCVGSCSL